MKHIFAYGLSVIFLAGGIYLLTHGFSTAGGWILFAAAVLGVGALNSDNEK
jgi:hypothetical protein